MLGKSYEFVSSELAIDSRESWEKIWQVLGGFEHWASGPVQANYYYCYYYYIRLMAFFQDNLDKPAPER